MQVTQPVKRYRAVWERTTRRAVGENKFKTILVRAESSDSTEFDAFKDQDRGSLIISDSEGNAIHSIATTVMVAKSTMKACETGKYDPFPVVKKKDRRKETM